MRKRINWRLVLQGDERGILKGLGGEEKTCIDVVLLQARILPRDLIHGGAMGKKSQDVLHDEPCAPDDRFANQHFEIYYYPFQKLFVVHNDFVGCSFLLQAKAATIRNQYLKDLQSSFVSDRSYQSRRRSLQALSFLNRVVISPIELRADLVMES